MASNQKVAIITGATSGIGSWYAAHLHSLGYRVVLTARRTDLGTAAAAALDPASRTAIFIPSDVSSYTSQTTLFQTVWSTFGRIDVFIANAGIIDGDSKYNFSLRDAPLDQMPPEPNTTCTDTDFKSIIYTTTLARHFMRHNNAGGKTTPPSQRGKIIITGSLVGIYPCATFPEYCSAKAAAHQWVRTVGPVLRAKDGITLNCVMPGGIETDAMPGFSVAFRPEQMTGRETLFAAFDRFVGHDQEFARSGELVEAAHDRVVEWGHPPYKSGPFARRTEKVYEPWFKMLHGEESGLTGTLRGPPTQGGKVIVVTGATGSQGGGVVNVMKKVPGWRVRAVTRNAGSDAAKKLAAEGVEVVEASYDHVESLVRAFEGANAVFAVTNWWEHLFQGKTQDEAGEIEEAQGMNLARAAAATFTLENYIWSTTPSAKRTTLGKLRTPHMDYKANVDARIKAELPDLAAITTYLYFGYYPQNMAFFPLLKPIPHPGNGQWIQTVPSRPDAKILLSGDMTVNPGIWVRQVLATKTKAHGKYANVALEKMSFGDMMRMWSEVTGKKGVYVETTAEAWSNMWGPAGHELALQFKYGEMCDPWEENDQFINHVELGIDETEVVGFRGTIEGLKHLFS